MVHRYSDGTGVGRFPLYGVSALRDAGHCAGPVSYTHLDVYKRQGYIYVAQIALGANPAQAVKAIAEAEAYPGPSLIKMCIRDRLSGKASILGGIILIGIGLEIFISGVF